MKQRPVSALAGILALLSACGGGGGGGTASSGGGTVSGGGTTTSGCTLRERQDWAATQLREWYLFPETLPATLDPAP